MLPLNSCRNTGRSGKQQKKCFVQFAVGMAGIQILLYIIGGLFSGFGKSPSSFTPLGISENIFYVGMMLVGWN